MVRAGGVEERIPGGMNQVSLTPKAWRASCLARRRRAGRIAGVSKWNERNPWKTGHNDDGAPKGRQESVWCPQGT